MIRAALLVFCPIAGVVMLGGVASAQDLRRPQDWSLTGNAGTDPVVNFLGTTDAQAVTLRTNNQERMRITETGNVNVGTSNSTSRLSILSNAPDVSLGMLNLDVTAPFAQRHRVLTATKRNAANTGQLDWTLELEAGDTPGLELFRVARPAGAPPDFLRGALRLGWDGRVGIGTTSPREKLHVVGNVRFVCADRCVSGGSWNGVTSGVTGATIAGGGKGLTFREGADPNVVTDDYGTVGGGLGNRAGDSAGTVQDKVAATVSGGAHNTASGAASSVGGGEENLSSGDASTIGGGGQNQASGGASTVGGGRSNTTSGQDATIAGGSGNVAGSLRATVGGGGGNTASGSWATIGGGQGNTASSENATLSGGVANTASGKNATVGGGNNNIAGTDNSTVAGGEFNVVHVFGQGAIGGGHYNTVRGADSFLGGGNRNTINNAGYAFLGGGAFNVVEGGTFASVAGGNSNTASGYAATVPGGELVTAAGDYSFAAGRRAKASHQGSFVWADSTSSSFESTANNQFNVRAGGGARVFSNSQASTGVELLPGGNAWSPVSDRSLKENFVVLDGREILDSLSRIPILEWNLKSQDPGVRHLGPMAQDFHAAFGLGESERHISTGDADGVALISIQALYQLSLEKEQEIKKLRQELTEKEQAITELQASDAGLRAQTAVLHQQIAGLDARLAAVEQAARLQPANAEARTSY